MQQDAPKLDDQSVQLEILVAIQCNDDDETSQVHFQNCAFLYQYVQGFAFAHLTFCNSLQDRMANAFCAIFPYGRVKYCVLD